MALTLLTAPAAEPLTLAEAKAWLRIDAADDDAAIADTLRAARLAVEAASGRLLMPQTWRWTLDRWPPNGRATVPLSPLRGLSAGRVVSATGAATPVAVADFTLDLAADPPRLVVLRAQPDPGRAVGGIELDLLVGHASAVAIPETLRLAVRLTLARLYENRGEAVAGDGGALPEAARALIAPHLRRRLP